MTVWDGLCHPRIGVLEVWSLVGELGSDLGGVGPRGRQGGSQGHHPQEEFWHHRVNKLLGVWLVLQGGQPRHQVSIAHDCFFSHSPLCCNPTNKVSLLARQLYLLYLRFPSLSNCELSRPLPFTKGQPQLLCYGDGKQTDDGVNCALLDIDNTLGSVSGFTPQTPLASSLHGGFSWGRWL